MLSKTSLIEALAITPVIGIARRCPAARAGVVAKAASSGGLRVIELTMDAPDACDAIAAARHAAPSLLVGAGTVRTVRAAQDAIAAGASFLVSPGFDPAVVHHALDAGVDCVPGVMTPTEVEQASRLVPVVKLFPAGPLGTDYVRTLREPFAEVGLVCTGGVNASNARAFLEAGAIAVGVGGAAFPASALSAGDGDAVCAAVAEVVAAVKQAG
jgi:2-dehydro-3-deoxyphosphogluconate aldolase/(4S)-4-hydroxy-2-oxoglutarate aldolase